MDFTVLNGYLVTTIIGVCLCIGYILKKWVKDVDNKYMSIYKEENNKKDCFEHLISLQGMYFPQSGSYCVYYFLYILYILFIRGIRGS